MEEENKVEEKKRIFGFRSQKKWKMAIAVLYYLIGILMIRNIIVKNDTIIFKVAETIDIILYFSPFILLSDFSKGIRNKIPLLKANTNGKTIIFFLILVIIITGVTSNIRGTAIEKDADIIREELENIDNEDTEEVLEETKTEQENKDEEEKVKKEEEEKAKKEAEEKSKKEAEEKAKKEAEEKAKKEAEKAKKEAEKAEKNFVFDGISYEYKGFKTKTRKN